jgi:hypothetical protein
VSAEAKQVSQVAIEEGAASEQATVDRQASGARKAR